MIAAFGALLIALVLIQDISPEQGWLHAGWYIALLGALIAALFWRIGKRSAPGRLWIGLGAMLVGIAGFSAALFGADLQTLVRAPGERVNLEEPQGIAAFPFTEDPAAASLRVSLVRGSSSIDVGPSKRYLMQYVVWTVPRDMAEVSVGTARDEHLTVTQPSGTAFLSPVLLFAQTAAIAGKEYPVDTFSVPAVRRQVKAVYFSAGDVARLKTASAGPALLVAVEDDAGNVLPGALRMIATGSQATVGGLTIHVRTLTYPALVIASAPLLPLLVLGIGAYAVGLVVWLRR